MTIIGENEEKLQACNTLLPALALACVLVMSSRLCQIS